MLELLNNFVSGQSSFVNEYDSYSYLAYFNLKYYIEKIMALMIITYIFISETKPKNNLNYYNLVLKTKN
jgi:hypothetical protein